MTTSKETGTRLPHDRGAASRRRRGSRTAKIAAIVGLLLAGLLGTQTAAAVSSGPMGLDGYCRHLGYAGATLVEFNAYGWRCRSAGGQTVSMDLYDVCAYEYRGKLPVPRYSNFQDPYSWSCNAAQPPEPPDPEVPDGPTDPQFPVEFDTGWKKLRKGWWMRTEFTVYRNMLEAVTHLDSNKLLGFTGGVVALLVDDTGTVVHRTALHKFGVNGYSERTREWFEDLPPEAVDRPFHLVPLQYYTPRTLEQVIDSIIDPAIQVAKGVAEVCEQIARTGVTCKELVAASQGSGG